MFRILKSGPERVTDAIAGFEKIIQELEAAQVLCVEEAESLHKQIVALGNAQTAANIARARAAQVRGKLRDLIGG